MVSPLGFCGRGQPALQLVGEHQVGQLGLARRPPVRSDGAPTAGRRVDFRADVVRDAGHHDHPGAIHRKEVAQQQSGQREMAQMVRAEL